MSELIGKWQEKYLNPINLVFDNKSKHAEINLWLWNQAKKKGSMVAFLTSGDARVEPVGIFDNQGCVIVNTKSPEYFSHLFTHEMIQTVVVLNNFDARRNYEQPWNNVDLLIETLSSSLETALQTEKPVMAAAFDHISYRAYPLAVFANRGREVNSVLPIYYLLNKTGLKREEFIEMPTLEKSELGVWPGLELFGQMLENNEAIAEKITTDPNIDLASIQKTLNPKSIVLTTVPIPPAGRYPEHFSLPNTCTVLHLPFTKKGSKVVGFNQQYLTEIRKQLDDMLNKAASAKEGEEYSDTVNLLIETPSLELSEEVLRIMNTDALKAWQESVQGKILLGQVQSGKTKEIKEV